MNNEINFKEQNDILTALEWTDRGLSIFKVIDDIQNPNLHPQVKIQSLFSTAVFSLLKEALFRSAHNEIQTMLTNYIKSGEVYIGTQIEQGKIDNIKEFLSNDFELYYNNRHYKLEEVDNIEFINNIFANKYFTQLNDYIDIYTNAEIYINNDSKNIYLYKCHWRRYGNKYQIRETEIKSL